MDRSEETRARILEQAAALFNQQGFAGASMSDLMQATGLQKGGIYWHFGSKEELAGEAFDLAVSRIRERLSAAVDVPAAAPDRLTAFVDAFRGLLLSPPLPGGCAVMNTAIESDDGNPVLRERARGAMESLLRTLERIVVQGKERGEIRSGIDAPGIATLMVSTLEGALAISRLLGDSRHMDRAAEHLRWLIDSQLRA